MHFRIKVLNVEGAPRLYQGSSQASTRVPAGIANALPRTSKQGPRDLATRGPLTKLIQERDV
jgi:hypothetical protein